MQMVLQLAMQNIGQLTDIRLSGAGWERRVLHREARLMQVPQAGQDGQPGSTTDVPAVFVTIDSLGATDPLAPEVPIEFAGAGAWQALVLASVL